MHYCMVNHAPYIGMHVFPRRILRYINQYNETFTRSVKDRLHSHEFREWKSFNSLQTFPVANICR